MESVQRCKFDLLIKNVKLVNVFNDSVTPASIGVNGKRIAYIGEAKASFKAADTIDGKGLYALPGFIDSHMHLESSMLPPQAFACRALECGTTMVAADPHEIGNVLGAKGVYALLEAVSGTPLKVLMLAPSTVPAAPGFEGSGCAVGSSEAAEMLDHPGIFGLGEVMDFNGVADGEENILAVIREARERGRMIDGHAAVLTGERLQRFAAAGIDSDHTVMSPEKLRELLALGFCVQVQENGLSAEMVQAMNELPVSNRVCLVTDDVALDKLMHQGHLNHVVAQAITLGLDPLKAIRFATINAADRLRQYDTGAIAPGRLANIQLVQDLSNPKPELLMVEGSVILERGRLKFSPQPRDLSVLREHPMQVKEIRPGDFFLGVDAKPSDRWAEVNIIHQNGFNYRTERRLQELLLIDSAQGRTVDITGLFKMAVFNRYGLERYSLALIDGMEDFDGAIALTYGHDAHNLTVYGSDDGDMALAANAVRRMHGGMCAVQKGTVLAQVPLPLGGLMSEEPAEVLTAQVDAFLTACQKTGLRHAKPISFLTLMPLAVSPEIKCTDMGLIDVVNKCKLPLFEKFY